MSDRNRRRHYRVAQRELQEEQAKSCGLTCCQKKWIVAAGMGCVIMIFLKGVLFGMAYARWKDES